MFSSIIKGIKAYFGSFSLISKLRLWKYFTVPILISFLTGAIFLAGAYFLSTPIGNFIAKIWVWEWGAETFTTISHFIGGLVILALGFVLYKHIVLALSAPFMSPVSEKIEKHLLGDQYEFVSKNTFRQQLLRGIRINVRNLLKELLIVIPLLILSFIPIIGLTATILILLVQSYYVGFGNMDYTMERHFVYKNSVKFVKNHKGTAIGNGLVFTLLLFIPILGLIFTLPIAVVAASKETVSLLKTEGYYNSYKKISTVSIINSKNDQR